MDIQSGCQLVSPPYFLFLLRSLPFNLGDLALEKTNKNEGARLCTKEGVPGGSDVNDRIRSEMNAGERVVIALRGGWREGRMISDSTAKKKYQQLEE